VNKRIAKDFDDYADRFPKDVQQLLLKMRQTVQKAAPEATETISYRIPAFWIDLFLVWLAAQKNSFGVDASDFWIARCKKEIFAYISGYDFVQFPFDEPLPLALIARIMRNRLHEQRAKRKKK